MYLTNCPKIPHKLPDTCETCESFNNGIKTGHHTFLAYDWGYTLTDGTCLWFCSKKCFEMSPVPTIDDGKWK